MSLMTSGREQDQEIAVALEILRVILEALAAEVRLGQLVALDHRAHRAVEDEDPPGQQGAQGVEDRRVSDSHVSCPQ